LFVSRSPPAVAGRIIAIIVYSLNRFGLARLAHILQELLEAPPPSAHTDTTAAVVFVILVVRVLAPLPQIHPDFVHSHTGTAVLELLIPGRFSSQTAATSCLPAS
jgi:hypothetical protein